MLLGCIPSADNFDTGRLEDEDGKDETEDADASEAKEGGDDDDVVEVPKSEGELLFERMVALDPSMEGACVWWDNGQNERLVLMRARIPSTPMLFDIIVAMFCRGVCSCREQTQKKRILTTSQKRAPAWRMRSCQIAGLAMGCVARLIAHQLFQ